MKGLVPFSRRRTCPPSKPGLGSTLGLEEGEFMWQRHLQIKYRKDVVHDRRRANLKTTNHPEGGKVLAILPQISTIDCVVEQDDLTIIRGNTVLVGQNLRSKCSHEVKQKACSSMANNQERRFEARKNQSHRRILEVV